MHSRHVSLGAAANGAGRWLVALNAAATGHKPHLSDRATLSPAGVNAMHRGAGRRHVYEGCDGPGEWVARRGPSPCGHSSANRYVGALTGSRASTCMHAASLTAVSARPRETSPRLSLKVSASMHPPPRAPPLSLSLSLSAARVAPTRFFALLCREASGMGQNLIADADESLLEIEEGGRAGG